MKKSHLLASFAAFLAVIVASPSVAQLNTPAASPTSDLKQTVGLTDIEVSYSRPSKKGRNIFGSLVPYGSIWRTGANQPTKISFSDDVTFGGRSIPAGTYALYTIPQEKEWMVIVYAKTDLWGAFGYEQKHDVARFSVATQKLESVVESFTIGLDDLSNDSAVMHLDWDKTRVAIPIKVPTDKKVMSQIDKLKGTKDFEKPGVLFAAGTYYHESNRELETALAWVSQACEQSERPAFWMYARKARIELDLGRKSAAKASAEKTLELATAAGNEDYQKIAKDILASL